MTTETCIEVVKQFSGAVALAALIVKLLQPSYSTWVEKVFVPALFLWLFTTFYGNF